MAVMFAGVLILSGFLIKSYARKDTRLDNNNNNNNKGEQMYATFLLYTFFTIMAYAISKLSQKTKSEVRLLMLQYANNRRYMVLSVESIFDKMKDNSN